jgi:hypothetical protein
VSLAIGLSSNGKDNVCAVRAKRFDQLLLRWHISHPTSDLRTP